ncbi:MAG: C45 family peptidase [Steroidobacteraceae bacterium]
MQLNFRLISEDRPAAEWLALFRQLWPHHRAWYLSESLRDRPTFLECRRAVGKYLPEFLPLYRELCELAGGGDLESRFLSLYCPPAYLSACSQAVWQGSPPLLVRNYDYSPQAFDAVLLRSRWLGRRVLGMSDCITGLLDGINDCGLAVTLTFGGRRVVGKGFGVPIILRYVLETCETVAEAAAVLTRVPCHMAYNVTVLDAAGNWATVYLGPDRKAFVSRAAVATNHQERVDWATHAAATASVERERFLLNELARGRPTKEEFIAAFLRPPVYSLAFDRGFGTLYTAVYSVAEGSLQMHWPGATWPIALESDSIGGFPIHYPSHAVLAATR